MWTLWTMWWMWTLLWTMWGLWTMLWRLWTLLLAATSSEGNLRINKHNAVNFKFVNSDTRSPCAVILATLAPVSECVAELLRLVWPVWSRILGRSLVLDRTFSIQCVFRARLDTETETLDFYNWL
ncbi:hypothetical protein ACLKA7_002511 [Drosophila subpalustris]